MESELKQESQSQEPVTVLNIQDDIVIDRLSDLGYVYSLLGSVGLTKDEARKVYDAWVDEGISAEEKSEKKGLGYFSVKPEPEEYSRRNLFWIKKLELREPGITSSLFHEFGIRCFHRYPVDILLRQYRKRNDRTPYGLLIGAISDHNDAFSDRDRMRIYSNVVHELNKHGYELRIIEVNGLTELQKSLIKLNQRYSPSNSLRMSGKSPDLPNGEYKISFAIVAGHGTPDSVRFGTKGTNNYTHMTKESLLDTVLVKGQPVPNLGVRRARNIFVSSPEIIFESCSTGIDEGIAQLTSEAFNARSVGPDIPTRIKDIEVIFDGDNNPHFKVTYEKGVGNQYFQGEKNLKES